MTQRIRSAGMYDRMVKEQLRIYGKLVTPIGQEVLNKESNLKPNERRSVTRMAKDMQKVRTTRKQTGWVESEVQREFRLAAVPDQLAGLTLE